MSLLFELIRQLLEYLGIPPDRLVPIWESYTQRRSIVRAIGNRLPAVFFQGIDIQCLQVFERKGYGWSRSVVRIIGTLLPLEPCSRAHFQRIVGPGVYEPKENGAVFRPGVPSLADAPCLLEDDSMSYRFRHALPSSESFQKLMGDSDNNPGSVPFAVAPSDHAIQKIAALEDELVQLRAQIAAIVALQEAKNIQFCSETICSFGSPNSALSPPPLVSTPLSLQFVQPTPAPPPPPPPPPPPVPSTKLGSAKSAIELIKERKASHKSGSSPIEKNAAVQGIANKLPNMLDVLKNMNSIRLRAVERSPGGTPLTSKYKKRRSLNDPAAIIAHALKQKFAHRNHNDDSFEKENKSQEGSPFSSPETPMFGRHLLKPAGKRIQKEMSKKPVLIKSGPPRVEKSACSGRIL